MERPTAELHSDRHEQVRVTVEEQEYEFRLPVAIGPEPDQCPVHVARHLIGIASGTKEYEIVGSLKTPKAPPLTAIEPPPPPAPTTDNRQPTTDDRRPTTDDRPADEQPPSNQLSATESVAPVVALPATRPVAAARRGPRGSKNKAV